MDDMTQHSYVAHLRCLSSLTAHYGTDHLHLRVLCQKLSCPESLDENRDSQRRRFNAIPATTNATSKSTQHTTASTPPTATGTAIAITSELLSLPPPLLSDSGDASTLKSGS
eukprot:TRINITY_DN9889_c0_g1_i1.p1 TRINITY_DN9889_c0_g1~~TRINITY_DN9889_c0_g1_i1.p1  ORF type:complete len:112 (-),score=18.96 TRINITY_DN9889_c0_g1_i1:45-380(-)